MLYRNSLCRKYLFPELFAVMMLAFSNSAASNSIRPELADSPQAPIQQDSPWLQGATETDDLQDLDQAYFPWHPTGRPVSKNQNSPGCTWITHSASDASGINGIHFLSGGLFFVRITDNSDPSSPSELLCLMDENGKIILTIVLPLQTGGGVNTLGTSDGDLSAPAVYTSQ